MIRRGRKRLLGAYAGNPDRFGSERSFAPPVGAHWRDGTKPRGYYIDFGLKVESPEWPPFWLAPLERQLHVATVQWGLGAFERYVAGDGEAWLEGALGAARHLVSLQAREGRQAGGWLHRFAMPHTYRLDPPWISAITQGEAASLLVRLAAETGEERFADAARLALAPFDVPAAEGGCLAPLVGSDFVEEYPTHPSSYVLNGAIFALWGVRDAGEALADTEIASRFETLADGLAANLWRWDTGYWSLYDLYPHPVPNVASPAYHLLHIKQLRVLAELAPRPQFEPMASRFERYRGSRIYRSQAMSRKIAFRLVVPRNRTLAHRLPWAAPEQAARRASRDGAAGPRRGDVVVLCYHAVSRRWDAALSVTPEAFERQLELMVEDGYHGVTFSEAVLGRPQGRVLAVTFDDGFRSVVDQARPILDRLGLVATVFVPTDYIGKAEPMSWSGIDHWMGGEFEHELSPMTWEQADSLIESGWEIGSHSCSHPRLSEIGEEQLRRELTASREECERRLGVSCRSLAYPYGDYDEAVLRAAEEAGYLAAGTLPRRSPAPEPLHWPRIGIYHGETDRSFRLKISPWVRRLRRSPLWVPLSVAMRPLRRTPEAAS